MGNLKSVSNAFELIGEKVEITNKITNIKNSDAIVLPGVGSFAQGMKNLEKLGLLEILNVEILEKKKPYLGICLGLEFLADRSYEDGITKGFGWIKGEIKKLSDKNNFKIPHMGWDDTVNGDSNGLFKDMKNPIFYYVHSYYFDIHYSEEKYITSKCQYGENQINSSIQKNNIYAVQFHPEKSQETGLKIIKNFVDIIN